MAKKLLITGATGFIGRSCLNLLYNTNFEIHALHRGARFNEAFAIHWHQCDIHNHGQLAQLLQQIQPEYLLHFAWFVEHQVFWSSEKNIDYVTSTLNLYKHFSLNRGIKAVFVGTCAEYQDNQPIYIEDKTPLHPNTLYGKAKKQTFDLLTELKNQNPQLASFVWARLFNIFGPYENPKRLIPYIFNSYFNHEQPILNNPFSKRDFLYVDDFNSMILALLNSEFAGAINTGNDEHFFIHEIADYIHSRYFANLPKPSYTNNSTCHHLIPDLNNLKRLHIKPQKSLIERLDDTYQWWLNHRLRAQA